MFRTIDRYLTKQILLASVVFVAVFSGPVIFLSLASHLPEEALFTGLMWPALLSIGPMILYHVLPALVAVAIVWCYGRFATEGILLTIFSTGRSTFSVRLPALAVAMAAVVLGYALTCFVIPRTAGHLHDVLYSLRHGVNPALLQVGKFNQFDHGREVIFFEKYINKNELAEVFIREVRPDNEERVFRARYAIFDRGEVGAGVVLLDGTLQTLSSDQSQVRAVAYDRMFVPLSGYGGPTFRRDYTIVDELPLLRFLEECSRALADPVEARSWVHEAINRFFIPILAIVHTWLGLELLPVWRNLNNRRPDRAPLVCVIVALVHFLIIVSIEQTIRDMQLAWITAGLVCAELTVGLALMFVRKGALGQQPETNALRVFGAQENPLPFELSGVPVQDVMVGVLDGETPLISCGGLGGMQESTA